MSEAQETVAETCARLAADGLAKLQEFDPGEPVITHVSADSCTVVQHFERSRHLCRMCPK